MIAAAPHAALRRLLVVVGVAAALVAIASAPWALGIGWLDFAFKPLATLCVIGGGLFVLSDAILAADRFVGGVPLPTLWNLSLYWLAQWLIARAAVASHNESRIVP